MFLSLAKLIEAPKCHCFTSMLFALRLFVQGILPVVKSSMSHPAYCHSCSLHFPLTLLKSPINELYFDAIILFSAGTMDEDKISAQKSICIIEL